MTPDSFSDGGKFAAADAAAAQAVSLLEAGADVIDVGGESTRPGATPVPPDEETARVVPVIERLSAETDAVISVDTTKADVARAALRAGAHIVNDVSGMTFDPEMPAVCAEADCAVVAMHIQGTPQDMQDDPRYDDVVNEVDAFLVERLAALKEAGVSPDRVLLDPGIGFGKTAAHNLALMAAVPRLRARRPVLVGHSRKRFLKAVLGREVEERLAGTLGVAVALARLGADVLRVHDVAAIRDAIDGANAVLDFDAVR